MLILCLYKCYYLYFFLNNVYLLSAYKVFVELCPFLIFSYWAELAHFEECSDTQFSWQWCLRWCMNISCRKSFIFRDRPRLTFENTVSKILEEGHVKSMKMPRRTCMKRLMTVDEAKEVCGDRNVWRSVPSDYPARDKTWS